MPFNLELQDSAKIGIGKILKIFNCTSVTQFLMLRNFHKKKTFNLKKTPSTYAHFIKKVSIKRKFSEYMCTLKIPELEPPCRLLAWEYSPLAFLRLHPSLHFITIHVYYIL